MHKFVHSPEETTKIKYPPFKIDMNISILNHKTQNCYRNSQLVVDEDEVWNRISKFATFIVETCS